MDRTIDLVEDALTDAAELPRGAGLTARLPALIHRRRRTATVRTVVAAAVVGAVTASAFALVPRHRAEPPAAPPLGMLGAPMITDRYTPDSSVSVNGVSPGATTAVLTTPDGRWEFEAVAPGATSAIQLAAWRARGEETTVNGRPGFYVVGIYPDLVSGGFGRDRGRPEIPAPSLAWEYADNAWAFLYGCGQCADPRPALHRAAALIRFDPAATLHTPLLPGPDPALWRLTGVERVDPDRDNGVTFVRADRPYALRLDVHDPVTAGDYQLTAEPAGHTPLDADETIDGHPVHWNGLNVPNDERYEAIVDIGTCRIYVDTARHSDTVRAIGSLQVADCTDPTTWWDARDAGLPPIWTAHDAMPIWLPKLDR
jgi:hypothetical protein